MDWHSDSLGGQLDILYRPVAAQNADGRLEVFARGADGNLWHNAQTSPGGAWSNWTSVAAGGIYSPLVGRNADGRLEVLSIGTDGALWHIVQTQPGGFFSGWQSLGGAELGLYTQHLVLAQNLDGRLELVAYTGAGLAHIWQTAPNGSWSGWEHFSGDIFPLFAIAQNEDGHLEIFAQGATMDYPLLHRWQSLPQVEWSEWGNFGGALLIPAYTPNLSGGIELGRNQDGRLEVFIIAQAGDMQHAWQTAPNNGWSELESLGGGGQLRGKLQVAQNADGRLEVFAFDLRIGGSWHIWQIAPGGSWSDWEFFCPFQVGSIAQNADGRLGAFGVGPDLGLWSVTQVTPGAWK